MFSFGLVLLYMADPSSFSWMNLKGGRIPEGLETFNENPSLVRECIDKNSFFLDILSITTLLNRMLDFDPNQRPDFIEIEDILIYTLNCPFRFYTPIYLDGKVKSVGGCEIALKTFLSEDMGEINSTLFREKLYIAVKVPNNFFELVLALPKGNEKSTNILYEEYKKKYLISKELENKIKTKLKRDLTAFEKLIFLYTCESKFYGELNLNLAQNISSDYIEYIRATIFHSREKENSNYQVQSDTVYRVGKVSRGKDSENSRKLRLSYFPGIFFYWPSFTSTSKKLERVEKFARGKIDFSKDDMIIFRIKLNLKNKYNKFDIDKLNPYGEEEVLLFPYFHFSVTNVEPKPFKIKNNTEEISFMLIDIEEADEASLPIQLLWFDPNMSSEENKKYQLYFTDFFKLSPCYFAKSIPEAITIIETEKTVKFLVISCGSAGKPFIDQIYKRDNIYKICLFCINEELHSKWFNKDRYPNFLGIYSDFNKLKEMLPFYAY